MRHLSSELDYRDQTREERFDVLTTPEILLEHKDRIPIGSPGDAIDELSGGHRQLLEAPEFFIAPGSVLKKVTPEEEVEWAVDYSKLPKELTKVIDTLEQLDINFSPLLEQIKITNDEDVLLWLANNFEEFVEDPSIAMEDELEDLGENPWGTNSFYIKTSRGRRKDSYRTVERPKANKFKEASARRDKHLSIRKEEVRALYSIPQIEEFIFRIGNVYKEDRELITLWSDQWRRRDRELYYLVLRSQGLDYETIRGKLWFAFDREAQTFERKIKIQPLAKDWTSSYNEENHCVEEEGLLSKEELNRRKEREVRCKRDPECINEATMERTKTQMAWWDYQKSEAFCSLNQTKTQWQRLYHLIWIRMERVLLTQAKGCKTEFEKMKCRTNLQRWQEKLNRKRVRLIIKTIEGAK